ncbi:MAG: 30S ribosome-binding factor RbfA, partial [Planctomycetota bacterium]
PSPPPATCRLTYPPPLATHRRMSQRQKQIEELLKRTVATVLQRGLADPRIKGLVSVTRVECSVDLKTAKVFVSVMPEEHEAITMHGLGDATRHVQQQVKKAVALRLVPHLRFVVDQDLKKQAAVFAAIDEGMKRTAQTTAKPDPETPEASV